MPQCCVSNVISKRVYAETEQGVCVLKSKAVAGVGISYPTP